LLNVKVLSFDLDGTLIRKGFDDIFWNQLIPELFAERCKISFEQAQKFVIKEYDQIGTDDPRWYIPEYWFERFEIAADIQEVLKKVRYAEGVYDDLYLLGDFSKKYRVVISTNNPRVILEHKLQVLKNVRQFISHTFSSVSDFKNIVKSEEFYNSICKQMAVKPEQLLHVGDDTKHDLAIPRSVGVNALLIDREKKIDGEHVIHSLAELKNMLHA
jgi:putative hydrolase of the HAD superfamily